MNFFNAFVVFIQFGSINLKDFFDSNYFVALFLTQLKYLLVKITLIASYSNSPVINQTFNNKNKLNMFFMTASTITLEFYDHTIPI